MVSPNHGWKKRKPRRATPAGASEPSRRPRPTPRRPSARSGSFPRAPASQTLRAGCQEWKPRDGAGETTAVIPVRNAVAGDVTTGAEADATGPLDVASSRGQRRRGDRPPKKQHRDVETVASAP